MRLIDADVLKRRAITVRFFGKDIMMVPTAEIDDAPTIEAEPVRHGLWIEDSLVSTNGGTYGVRRCSLCGAYYQDVGYGWNYCPNCGAKMDKEADDE